MSRNNQAMATQNMPTPARLKVIKGPHKGVSYKLVASKVTIGRSHENDIVLEEDEKCSRKQAILKLGSNNMYSIKDISNKSTLKVNNMVQFQSNLQDGDVIQFGSTTLQFSFKAPPQRPQAMNQAMTPLAPVPVKPKAKSGDQIIPLEVSENSGLAAIPPEQNISPEAHNYQTPYTPPPPPLKKKRRKKKSLLPKIILLFLVLGGFWLFTEDSSDTTSEQKKDLLRTEKDAEENLKTLAELKEKEEQDREKKRSVSYKNAQAAYIKGIRDYRKGVYVRAIESFRACKILYPQHELCGSYLQKSEAKVQQLIQAWMIAGKEYREKRRFSACMSSFQNVMTAITAVKKAGSQTTFNEAKENFKICQLKYEDRY